MMLWVGRNMFCFFTMIVQDARNNVVVVLFFKKEVPRGAGTGIEKRIIRSIFC